MSKCDFFSEGGPGGSPEAILAQFWTTSGTSLEPFGELWVLLGGPWGLPGGSLGSLGAPWVLLGSNFGILGVSWASFLLLGSILDAILAILEEF